MKSPFITTSDAAEYLLFTKADGTPDLRRLHKFLANYRLTIRTVKRGTITLIDKASLDAHLTRQQRVLKPRSSQSQHSERSLHHAGVSQQAIRDVHAASVGEAATTTHYKTVVGG